MDELKSTAYILVILFLGMLFVVWKGRVDLGGAQDQIATLQHDLAAERSFSDEVFVENQQLRDANGKLRLKMLELEVNLSTEQEKVDACLASVPAMRDTFASLAPPRHRVSVSDLLITPDLVVISIANLTPGVVAPTGSMEPLLGADTIVLERTPTSSSEIYLGDIIIYELDDARIIHRVVRIGWDAQGWFAITRGDNNLYDDPAPVRFAQVRGIVVGIVY